MIKYIKKMRSSHNGIEQFRNDDNIMLNVGKSFTEDELKRTKFSTLLAENMEIIGNVIGDNADIVVREVNIGRSGVRSGVVLYFDNLVDSSLLDGEIIRPLVVEAHTSGLHTGDEIVEQIYAGNLITRAQIKKNDNLKNLLEGLLMGEAGLLIDGIKGFFTINIRGYDYREVSEPEVETVVRGPKDSFIETINTNIGLIRRRIQSPNLTIKTLKIGEVTKTMVCITYIKGICPSKLAKEVYRRLEKINIDGVLESGYIEEFIQDNPFTPFPQMRNTERPDVAAAALLEGRVVIITDHTPVVLIAPGEFFSLLQSSEDYYNRFYFATATRVLRYLAIVIVLLFPASYIA
ncbi:MAG: spore germination protein, partial [Clostridiales bacterium]|nr:spore germination protein [Clostridiales bacterium]